jgi:glycosyltransferase involved in cell wall biosynthesis
MRGSLRRPAHLAATALFLLPILVCVAVSRARVNHDRRPRIVWGPVPIISIKYWSEALRRRGFESTTIVYDVYAINRRDDFDRVLDRGLLRPLSPYLAFCWVLLHADVVNGFFDGGFLAPTPLRWLEGRLLRAAGKKLVLSPYGSDIAVDELLGPFREPTRLSNPTLLAREPEIRRRVDYFSRWSDFIVRNVQPGYLPRWDVLWPTCLAIDTDAWSPQEPPERDTVIVVHSANHPALKGTDHLLAAVEQLEREGVRVRLELLRGASNDDVRRAVLGSDVVAEQFLAGYGLAAIEGLSAGKPVLAHMGWLGPEMLTATALRNCPILDTPAGSIADNLRPLAIDPARRRALGRAGRDYVLRHHSYEAVGRIWECIFLHVWSGAPRPTTESIYAEGASG